MFINRIKWLKAISILFFDNIKLKNIHEDNNFIYIGSAATIEEIRNSDLLKSLFDKYIDLISSTLIRNRATLGGNIVNASPIGDFSIILLALNAEIKISNHKYSRIIFLRDFYKGYKIDGYLSE